MKLLINTVFKRSTALFCLSTLVSSMTAASVVMTGTRVIFPANQNEKTVHLQNKDNNPNIVQVWLDSGDESSTPETADTPIIANPQIFKMAPNQGQIVRLIFTGDKSTLAKDRESIFYMNFSEIPASKSENTASNRLMLVFKNRVKVLYRPDNLAVPSHEISKHITYQWVGNNANQKIVLHNNSPYYANFSELNLTHAGQKKLIAKNQMIAPYSSREWAYSLKTTNTANVKINLNLINDYGVAVTTDLSNYKE